jgi:hypothetical protein
VKRVPFRSLPNEYNFSISIILPPKRVLFVPSDAMFVLIKTRSYASRVVASVCYMLICRLRSKITLLHLIPVKPPLFLPAHAFCLDKSPQNSMTTATRDYLDALLALSGNPLLTEVRQTLLEKLTDQELGEIGASCSLKYVSRADREEATSLLLDLVASRAKTSANEDQAEVSAPQPRSTNKRKQEENGERRKEARILNRVSGPDEEYTSDDSVDDRRFELNEEDSEWIKKAVTPVKPLLRRSRHEQTFLDIEKLLCVPDKHGNST